MEIINYKKNLEPINLKVVSKKSINNPYYFGFIEDMGLLKI